MYEVSCVGGSKVDAAAAIRNSSSRSHVSDSVKSQMMRFLRRSKSLARTSAERPFIAPVVSEQNNRYSHQPKSIFVEQNKHPPPPNNRSSSEKPKIQVARNGMVVAIVDGLPFVVNSKNKNRHNRRPIQVK